MVADVSKLELTDEIRSRADELYEANLIPLVFGAKTVDESTDKTTVKKAVSKMSSGGNDKTVNM